MTVRQILLWLSNKDDTIDYNDVEKQLRWALVHETKVNVGDIVSFKSDDDRQDCILAGKVTYSGICGLDVLVGDRIFAISERDIVPMPSEVKVGVSAVQQCILNQRVAARIEEATKWAIWKDGTQVIGIQEHPLKQYIDSIIREEEQSNDRREYKTMPSEEVKS